MESRYKSRSAAVGNIDAKARRLHRRSILQKTAREETFDRRRNLQLSPLLDESAVARISQSKRGIAVKGQTTKPASPTQPEPAKNSRREMLKKWKEEKELKKKIEKEKAAKKRTFKVCHVEHKDTKLYSKTGGAAKKKPEPKATVPARPVTRSSARLANKLAEDKSHPVAKKTVSAASSNKANERKPARSSTRIASKAPTVTATAPTSRRAKDNTKRQPVTREEPSSKAATTQGKKVTAADAKKKPAAAQNPFSLDFGRVSTKRGDGSSLQEESFAPKGFKFCAPSNVSSFIFKPLSPASTGAFLGIESKRRISTPHKQNINLSLFEPDVSVIKGSSDSQSDDNAPPAPVEKLFRAQSINDGSATKSSGGKRKNRRSVRFSNQSDNKPRHSSSSSSDDNDMDQETNSAKRVTRRSVSFASDPDEPAVKTPRISRLSGRKSTPYVKSSEKRVRIMDVMDQSLGEMEVEQSESITPVMTRTRKISERKATPAVVLRDCMMSDDDGDTPRSRAPKSQSEEGDASSSALSGNASGKKGTPRPSAAKQGHIMENEKQTPTGRSRRPSGRRLTPAPKLASAEEMDVSSPRRSRRISGRVATPLTQDKQIERTNKQETDNQEQKAMETQTDAVEKHDVPYFRRLVQSESGRLMSLCNKWDEVKKKEDITEDVVGQIFAAIGKAHLLMKERFGQFSGLIDDSEFNRGEKEITCMDLQGFWDMVAIQVDNVQAMFDELEKLKNNSWKKEETKVVKPQPQKKVVKKTKPVVAKSSKANDARAAARKRLAEAKAAMKAKFAEETSEKSRAEEVKTFDAGFFKVSSPVRTPGKHCEAGTPSKATPSGSRVANSSLTSKVLSPAIARLQQSPLATKTATPKNHTTRLRRSLCQKNTPGVEKTDKGDNIQSTFDFSKYLMPTQPVDSPAPLIDSPDTSNVNVVDLNMQAEEFMKTEPSRQLQDLTMRSPLKTRQAAQYSNSPVSAKSLSNNFSKISLMSNTPGQEKIDTENYLFTPFEKSSIHSNTMNDSVNLMSFDSPSGQPKQIGTISTSSLMNGLFSPLQTGPVRRSTRRSTANPNPNPALFSPL
ncbi:disks large-associated protein 5-like [Ptychodera flava]|uniref:disks large-associated protein 5-like n=1 Tax=Ptychodera flava TaxID=63121 RepID=UPI003969F291